MYKNALLSENYVEKAKGHLLKTTLLPDAITNNYSTTSFPVNALPLGETYL